MIIFVLVLPMLFILFYFILFFIVHITMIFVSVLRVCVPLSIIYFFLVNDLYFILALIHTCQESFLFCHYCLYPHRHHLYHFIFSTLQSQGENSENEFERHGLSLPIDYYGKFVCVCVCVLMSFFKYIIRHHLIMMPRRQEK